MMSLTELRLACLAKALELHPRGSAPAEQVIKSAAAFERYIADGADGEGDEAKED